MSSYEAFLQFMVTGITQGAIYAMIALGFTIIYKATTVINFAQGEFVMLGAMCAITIATSLGLPLWLSLPFSIIIITAVGGLMYKVSLSPMRKPSVIKLIIVTIGASTFLKGVAMQLWGEEVRPAGMLTPIDTSEMIRWGEVTIEPQRLWVILVLVLTVAGLNSFYKRTITGKAMRACASNPRAAGLMGIDVERMTLLTWAFSGALSSVAGIVIAPLTMMGFDMGTMFGLKGFCAAILGGLGSTTGAIAGGVLIGILESLGVGYVNSGLKDAFAFVIMLLVLFIRPSGIMGRKEMERV